MSHFDGLSQPKVRRLLNVLVEAPFFYKEDDPELFAYLRRHLKAFREFHVDMYGWELVVDARGARLLKDRWHNQALKPSQHDVFDLTRRDDCMAFLLVLEFHEHLLDERNASIDDPDPLRFEFGELLEFATNRMAEELADRALSQDDVKRVLRGLMPRLMRFRFLRELPPERDDTVDRENLIYQCLPALYLYDFRALGASPLAAALRADPTPDPEGDEDLETTT
jgi:hypothetical protein